VNGPWIDVSNLVSLSVQITNFSGSDIQVSNDPNVCIDGPGIGAPATAPVLSQFLASTGFQSGVSNLAAQTYFVKTTYVTAWGETTASGESTLAVLAGNYLFVAPPTNVPAGVIGWNVYVSTTTGTEVLQTGPQFSPQRLVDSIGTVGGTLAPSTGPQSGVHYAISGALPLKKNFMMLHGLQQTQWVPPVSDQSGSPNSGVSVTQGSGFTGSTDTTVAVWVNGGNVMWTPSCMTWQWLRVTNGGSTTAAYLNGQRG
jgi:hypothetical protein